MDAVIAAARTGSFAKAGRLLHMSTPAVAKQVNTFEKEYGLMLFERSRSGVTPTKAGREFVEDARMIVRQYEEIIRRMQRRAATNAGSVPGRPRRRLRPARRPTYAPPSDVRSTRRANRYGSPCARLHRIIITRCRSDDGPAEHAHRRRRIRWPILPDDELHDTQCSE